MQVAFGPDAAPPRSTVTAPRTAGIRRPTRQRARMAWDNQEEDAAPDANQSRCLLFWSLVLCLCYLGVSKESCQTRASGAMLVDMHEKQRDAET